MTLSYWLLLLMLFPIIGAAYSWKKFHSIEWWECLVSVFSALLICFATIKLAQLGAHADSETISGKITSASHTPYWHARWRETETYTVTEGKKTVTKTRVVTKTQDHPPTWVAHTTVGDISMSQGYFEQMGNKFGIQKELGWRPNFDHGDRMDYSVHVSDDSEFCDYPVSVRQAWKNPLKGSNSILKFEKISKEQAKKMGTPDYPAANPFLSNRVIGAPINPWNWDKMNTAIGAEKKVNLIIVFTDSLDKAKAIQSYWQNGKKNDLVVCYGGAANKAEWVYVFGWSKSELVKMNLQTIFLDNPVEDSIIELIKKEVRANFQPHEWKFYDHLETPIPVWSVVLAFIMMAGSQLLCFKYFTEN